MKFELYDYCWYWYSTQGFSHYKKHLGRGLRVANRVDQEMIYFIMSDNRKVIASRTVSALDLSDYDVNEKNVRLKDLDNTIKGRIDD